MNLHMVDLRHVKTGVHLSRAEIALSEYEALCARTERRQREAKEALTRRGVTPRTPISTAYVPPNVARNFIYTNVRGLA